MAAIKIGIVGVGKIVRDQHLPVLDGHKAFELVAAASRNAVVAGVENFTSLSDMLRACPQLDAVALCMPPQVRHESARIALSAGKHVLLEKPPGATLAEIDDLRALAKSASLSLYATWHSRHAPMVEAAKLFLSDAELRAVEIVWKEDVRHWHPGQDWIWRPGGFGVFDPGINALSIATHILPRPIVLKRSRLSFPENRAAPIAARLSFRDTAGIAVEADFDWRQTGPQIWGIVCETDKGRLCLSHGGARLRIGDFERPGAPEAEYRTIYDRFAAMVREGRSDVDLRPMQLVADAFLLAEHRKVEAFHDAR